MKQAKSLGETKTKQVMVYLPPVLIEKVHQAARENYRSISGEVAYILEQYFRQQQSSEPSQKEEES